MLDTFWTNVAVEALYRGRGGAIRDHCCSNFTEQQYAKKTTTLQSLLKYSDFQ